MKYLENHPSLPPRSTKPVKLVAPEVTAKPVARRRWKECNEERMLKALRKFGSLRLRVKFELYEVGDGGGAHRVYRKLEGRNLTFRRIPNQGTVFGIMDMVTEAAVRYVNERSEIQCRPDILGPKPNDAITGLPTDVDGARLRPE